MVTLKPIEYRKNKITLDDFVRPEYSKIISNEPQLAELAQEIKKAREKQKQVIFQIGAHVIKTGQSLLLIDLMKQGYITHLATNGAAAIHDFEISLIGATSEDVEQGLKDGTFGMWQETSEINEIINQAVRLNTGYGEALSSHVKNHKYKEYSLFAQAHLLGISPTVHIAIGTDINHTYPNFLPEAAAKTSYLDFEYYVNLIRKLQDGVIVNIGSAVILPEVFLKALSITRNEAEDKGCILDNFTAANMDQILHYRPTKNILERTGARGLNIQGKHEEMIQTLHRYLVNK